MNSKGKFNVPMGRYKNPSIVNEETLRRASELLQDVEIRKGDFTEILPMIQKGDFVYIDPPYYTDNGGFTTYTKDDFKPEDQERLANFCKKLNQKGAKFMASNSDTKFIRKLYKDFKIHTVLAKRMINSNAFGRGEITEVLVTNY